MRAGEIVGLGGLVGAGRTELARAAFGIDRLRGGEIRVFGRSLVLRAPADAILAGIGLVPEDRKQEALLLLRSVRNNVSLCVPQKVSRLGFIDRAAESRLVSALTRRLGVRTPWIEPGGAQALRRQPAEGGPRQWLAEPRILILDEPTRGIDVGAKLEIYRLIEELAEAGIAILVISSELTELLGLTDRIVVMRAGSIVGELPTAAATEEAVLALAMGQPAPEKAAA